MKKLIADNPKSATDKPRLDQFLFAKFGTTESLSKGQIRKLIVAGAVYLNGVRVRIASKPIFPGSRVEVYLDRERMAEKRVAPKIDADSILYEDDAIIVLNKPTGLPTQPTVDEARDNLYSQIKTFLRNRGQPELYVGLHHRLDSETSGVILFTKSEEANAPIARGFQERTIKKTYVALVERKKEIPEAFEIQNYLKKRDRAVGKKAKMFSVHSGGQAALTRFERMPDAKGFSRLMCFPETGRMHQIRAHLSEYGLPILGDELYDGESFERIMLHAWKLEFNHPLTGKKVLVEAPLPEDFQEDLSKQK